MPFLSSEAPPYGTGGLAEFVVRGAAVAAPFAYG
jgi:hypothetical protein